MVDMDMVDMDMVDMDMVHMDMVHMHMVDMDVDHLGFLPTKNWEITQHKSGGVRTSCKL